MPASFQLCPQFLEIVDLTVADDPYSPVFVSNRLVSSLEINDAKAAHTDSGAFTGIMAMIVGPAVNHHLAHSFQQTLLGLPALSQLNYAEYSTHIF